MRALIIASCLALAACTPATTTQVGGGIATVGETVTLKGTTALTLATDAYTAVAHSTEALVKAGHFSDTQLQMIRTLNDQALKLINGADASLTVAERAASLGLIVTQLHSIIGR